MAWPWPRQVHFRESSGLARLCALLIFLRTVEPVQPSDRSTAPPTAPPNADANAGAARAALAALAAACENSHNAGAADHWRRGMQHGTGPHGVSQADADVGTAAAQRERGNAQRRGTAHDAQ
jgi:hypothetical protein